MSFVLTPQRMAGELRKRPTPGPYSRPIGQDQSPDVGSGGGGGTAQLIGESSNAINTTGSPITLTTPVGTQVGDLIVLIQANDFYTLATLATPTGTAVTTWTEQTGSRYDGGTDGSHVKVWTGPAATAGAQTVIANYAAPSGGDEERFAQIIVFRDAAFDTGSSVIQVSSTTYTLPSVTASTAGSYLIGTVGTTTGVVNFTFPGSMTPLTERDVGGFCTYRTGWELVSGSGATGTRSVTSSTATAGFVSSISIKPTVVSYQGATNLSVGSTLSVGETLEAAGAVSLGAIATLTTAETLTAQGAVTLSASASLTAQPAPIIGAASLTTVQSLSLTAFLVQPGAVSLPISATLTSAGTAGGGGASLVSTATLSVSAQLTEVAAVLLSATGVLSPSGFAQRFAAVTLSSITALTAGAALTEFAAVSLSSTPSLAVAVTTQTMAAVVSMAASSTLQVTVGAAFANANLVVGKTLVVGATQILVAAVSLPVVSSLTAAAIRTTFGTVTLPVVPVLTATVSVRITQGTVGLTALGNLLASAGGATGSTNLVAGYVLSVNGATFKVGAANLTVTQILSVSGWLTAFGAAQLNVSPALSVAGRVGAFGVLNLTVLEQLTVGLGVISKVGACTLLVSAGLSFSITTAVSGSILLAAAALLRFVEVFPEVDFASVVGDWNVGGIHTDQRSLPHRQLVNAGGWTTAGIHVGSERS